MKIGSKQFIISICAVILLLTSGSKLFAQQIPVVADLPPDLIVETRRAPMKAIFDNVLWGSVTGALISAGWHLVDDSKTTDERFKVTSIADQAVTGATYGGLIGLGVGIYMSLMGVTFDSTMVTLDFSPVEEFDYHNQQRALYGNRDIKTAKNRVFSLQVRF